MHIFFPGGEEEEGKINKVNEFCETAIFYIEQKVHERSFLCVSLWVCNEQSRLKFFFSEIAKNIWLKFWRKFM